MHQMGVSENAAPYVLEAQNYVVSSFDASRKSLAPEDMTQIVADISKGMDKIEAKAEQDKALSENEVVAVLIATTAAKSLTGAIAEVSKDFFQNLDLTNSRNPIVLRCWLCSFARTWFNVVATVVVRSFSVIYVGTYVHEFLTTAVGPFAQSCLNGNCNADVLFGNLGRIIGYIEYDLTHYNCYLPDDLWQC